MQTPFEPQPTLVGQLLIVRPLRTDDYDELFAAASDPVIWEQHPAPDRYKEPVFRSFFDAAMASGSAFAFVDRQSGAIIGSSRYHGADESRREIEIGWTFLVRRCWGGTWNREAKQLMLSHSFRWFDTVVFWVGANNERSQRAMSKLGGVLRPGTVTRPLSGDQACVVFEIRRQDWMRATVAI